MKKMKLSRLLSSILLGLSLYGFSYTTAMAMSAEQAKAQGLISERCDGYVKANNASAEQIANQINQGRRAEYERIAHQTGSTAEQVAKITGQKLCGR